MYRFEYQLENGEIHSYRFHKGEYAINLYGMSILIEGVVNARVIDEGDDDNPETILLAHGKK